MAAPTFVSASAGSTDATGGWTHTGPAPGAVGRVVIVHLLQDGTNAGVPAITSVTNAANIGGVANTLTKIGQFDVGSPTPTARHHVWIGRTTSASSAMVITGTNTGGDDVYVRVYLFSGVSASTSLARVIENVTRGSTGVSAGTSATASDAAVTTLGPERLVVNLLAIDDDNPVGAFSGQTGGTWSEAVAEYATQSGTDGCIQIQTATLASAGTIDGGTASITDPDNWGVVGFALLPTGPAVYSAKVDLPVTDLFVTRGRLSFWSQVAMALSASTVTAGRLPTYGMVAWTRFTTPGAVNVKGASSTAAVWVSTTDGRATLSKGVAVLPVGFNVTIIPELDTETYGGGNFGSGDFGDERHSGAASLEITVDIFANGGEVQTITGAASFELAANSVVDGVRKTFGAVVAPETLESVTAARLGIQEQVTTLLAYSVVTSARVGVPTAVSLPITADIVTRSTTGGTVAGNVVASGTFGFSTSGRVTARSSVQFNEGLFFTTASLHNRRGTVSQTITAGMQTTGRLTAFGNVSFPVMVTISTGRVTRFGAVSFNIQFSTRTLKPTYNPPTVGYIRFVNRGRVRQGHEVVGV